MSLDNIILHERSSIEGINSVRNKDSFVLTEDGWRPLFSIKIGDKILSYNLGGELKFDTIVDKEVYEDNIINYNHSFWRFAVGQKHTWLGYRRMTLTGNSRSHIWDRRGHGNLSCEFHILNNPQRFYNNRTSNVTTDECSLLGWLLSDGYIKWSPDTKKTSSSKGSKRGVIATVTQNDNKHGAEIKELMVRLGGFKNAYLRKKVGNKCRNYTLNPAWFRDYWIRLGFGQTGKFEIDLIKFLLHQPTNNMESFMDAFQKADGHYSKQGKKVLTQNESNLSEGIFTAAYLLGYNPSSGSKGYYQNKTGKINRCMSYKLQTKPHQTTMRMKEDILYEEECVTLKLQDSDCFVVRQKDLITIA